MFRVIVRVWVRVCRRGRVKSLSFRVRFRVRVSCRVRVIV